MVSSHVMTELLIILPSYLPFSQLHVAEFQIYALFTHMILFRTFTFTCTFYRYSSFDLSYMFLLLDLHLHLDDICFVHGFAFFFPVIILST